MWLLTIWTASAADFAGTWTLSTPNEEVRAAVDAAVSASASTFPRVYRSVAKSRLTEKAEVCDRYVFRATETELAWTCDEKKELVVRLDQLGKPFEIRHQGQRATAVVTLKDGSLQARFDASDGHRTTVFSLHDDTLRVSATVNGSKIEIPLAWQVEYTRTPAEPS